MASRLHAREDTAFTYTVGHAGHLTVTQSIQTPAYKAIQVKSATVKSVLIPLFL